MTAVERRELERDQTATFWLQMENTECFDDIAIFAVEVPAKEHKKPEVMEAKDRELENLEKYDVFEEIEDTGQEKIGSWWVNLPVVTISPEILWPPIVLYIHIFDHPISLSL